MSRAAAGLMRVYLLQTPCREKGEGNSREGTVNSGGEDRRFGSLSRNLRMAADPG